MNSLMFWATGRSANDQPLTKAARVALEASLTPRVMKFTVDHDGTPIEIPREEPRPQIWLPFEATKEN